MWYKGHVRLICQSSLMELKLCQFPGAMIEARCSLGLARAVYKAFGVSQT